MHRSFSICFSSFILTSVFASAQNTVFRLDDLPSASPQEAVSREAAEHFEKARAESPEAVESLASGMISRGNADGHFLLGWAAEHPPQSWRPDLLKARLSYRAGADAGQAGCLVNLAALLMRSSAAHPEAGDLLKRALSDQPAWAGFYLGIHTLANAASSAEARESISIWQKAGEAGSSLAWRHLGMLYEGLPGFSDLKEPSKAAEAYRHGTAWGDLECAVRHGILLKKNPQLALKEESVEQLLASVINGNNRQAKFILAQFLEDEGEISAAKNLYLQMAEELAFAPAMMKLALLEAGGQVSNFPETAISWYRKAAAQNHAPALHQLGLRAAAQEEKPRAFQHYLNAALGGYAPSARLVAECYRRGIGTPADMYAAGAWLVRAVEAGDSDAMVDLAEMMLSGEGVPFSDQLLEQLCQRAFMAGNPRAALLYGMLHERGVERPTDKATALAYFQVAHGRGLSAATAMIERIKSNLSPGQLEDAQRKLADLLK